MRRAAGLLAAALAAGAAGAADEPYRVELLVFAQPEPAGEAAAAPGAAALPDEPAVDFRRYPCLPVGADPAAAPPLRDAADVAACLDGYLRLNELREAMAGDRLDLARAGGFRILAHAAWRQPALAPEAARRVRLAARARRDAARARGLGALLARAASAAGLPAALPARSGRAGAGHPAAPQAARRRDQLPGPSAHRRPRPGHAGAGGGRRTGGRRALSPALSLPARPRRAARAGSASGRRSRRRGGRRCPPPRTGSPA